MAAPLGICENGLIILNDPDCMSVFSSSEGNAIILSNNGEPLFTQKLSSRENKINLQNLPDGKYAIKIENSNHTSLVTFELNRNLT